MGVVTRICKVCQKSFETENKHKIICSDICRKINNRRKSDSRYHARKEHEARLKAGGIPRFCLKCEEEFISLGPGNRLCDLCGQTNRKTTMISPCIISW